MGSKLSLRSVLGEPAKPCCPLFCLSVYLHLRQISTQRMHTLKGILQPSWHLLVWVSNCFKANMALPWNRPARRRFFDLPTSEAFMRIGLIGDTHGYVPALEAAIAGCRDAGVDQIVHCGDFLSSTFSPDPPDETIT